jgi:hypothetical protein
MNVDDNTPLPVSNIGYFARGYPNKNFIGVSGWFVLGSKKWEGFLSKKEKIKVFKNKEEIIECLNRVRGVLDIILAEDIEVVLKREILDEQSRREFQLKTAKAPPGYHKMIEGRKAKARIRQRIKSVLKKKKRPQSRLIFSGFETKRRSH